MDSTKSGDEDLFGFDPDQKEPKNKSKAMGMLSKSFNPNH
jgi:hypothetical protein